MYFCHFLIHKCGFCEQKALRSYQITLEGTSYLSNFVQVIAITCICTQRSQSLRTILPLYVIFSHIVARATEKPLIAVQ